MKLNPYQHRLFGYHPLDQCSCCHWKQDQEPVVQREGQGQSHIQHIPAKSLKYDWLKAKMTAGSPQKLFLLNWQPS